MAPSPSLVRQTPGARSDPPFCRPSLFVRGCRLQWVVCSVLQSCSRAELIFMQTRHNPYIRIPYSPPCCIYLCTYIHIRINSNNNNEISVGWVVSTPVMYLSRLQKEKTSCSRTVASDPRLDCCTTSPNCQILLTVIYARVWRLSKVVQTRAYVRGNEGTMRTWIRKTYIRTRHQS